MRIERLRIGAFGRIHGLDTGDGPLPSLVAVHGPNEAGKTTLFHFLTTVLYGFHPASRDTHPYSPWEGGEVEGEARLRMAGGEMWQVRRRLLATPVGSLTRGGRQEELRNRILPCAEHVPPAVYRQVFALTLAELAGLEGESWAVIQDRLMGAMGAADVRPAREVAIQLEREAGELWRPTRRGRQRVRELRERMGALRERRAAAIGYDRQLRDTTVALEAVRKELRSLRDERTACRSYLERYRTLQPVRAQIRRIEGFEEEGGNPRELEGLPPNPDERLAQLDSTLREIEERSAAVAQETREPRARLEAFADAEERMVRRADSVSSLAALSLSLEGERLRRAQLEQEIRDLDHRAGALAAELFADGEPARAAVENDAGERARVLMALPIGELRESVRAYRSARESRRVAEESFGNIEPGGERTGIRRAWAGAALVAVGLLLLAIGVRGGSVSAASWSAPLMASGVALLIIGIGGHRQHERHRVGRVRAAETRATEEAMRRVATAHLQQLSLKGSAVAEPDMEVVGALERLQGLLRDLADRNRTLESLGSRDREVAARIAELGRELGLELPPDAPAAAHLLSARLRDAEGRKAAAAAARRELERLARERARLESDRERATQERDSLSGRLEALGAGDLTRGLAAARARLEARTLARRLRDELTHAHPDIEEIRARIAAAEAAGEEWAVDDDALERRRASEEELTDRIEASARRAEGLERDAERLRLLETADAVDGEILLLEEELADTRRERDRRWLLARIVREAERRFREEHQPDVIRRAGAHLSRITGGRYQKILMGDAQTEGMFLLQGPGYPSPIRVAEPISTGTREQVYLALRLAIIDHLDRGGERLPLFMDEAFVNWDPSRMERGLEVLSGVAEQRQVFLFTCHPEVVDRARRVGAGVVEMGASGS
jgi:uncharacterized protein YhaN